MKWNKKPKKHKKSELLKRKIKSKDKSMIN